MGLRLRQLLVVLGPRALVGGIYGVMRVGEATRAAIDATPLGGRGATFTVWLPAHEGPP